MHYYKKDEFTGYLETLQSVDRVEITALLHQAYSHCVGYSLAIYVQNQLTPSAVDILDIHVLKDCMEEQLINISNAKLGNSRQIEITNWESLTQLESLEYQNEFERNGLNEGLISLLDIENNYPPKQFYEYVLNEDFGVYQCRLTEQAKAYLRATTDDIIIPPPLYKYKGSRVTSCKSLFYKLKLKGKQVDFSLVDLSFYSYISNLFEKLAIDCLDVASFSLNPNKKEVSYLFTELECDTLNLNDCNFNGFDHISACFGKVNINKLQAKNCDISAITFKNITEYGLLFNDSRINEFDLEFFSKLSRKKNIFDCHTNVNIVSRSGFSNFLGGLDCFKFVNMDKLTIPVDYDGNLCVKLLFANLNIKELDLTDLCLEGVTNLEHMLSYLDCDNLIFDPKVLEKSESNANLLCSSIIGCDLDFSSMDGSRCSENMLEGLLYVKGRLTLPPNYNEQNSMKTTASAIYNSDGKLVALSRAIKPKLPTIGMVQATKLMKKYNIKKINLSHNLI